MFINKAKIQLFINKNILIACSLFLGMAGALWTTSAWTRKTLVGGGFASVTAPSRTRWNKRYFQPTLEHALENTSNPSKHTLGIQWTLHFYSIMT